MLKSRKKRQLKNIVTTPMADTKEKEHQEEIQLNLLVKLLRIKENTEENDEEIHEIFIAIAKNEIEKVKELLKTSQSSVAEEIQYFTTPIHVAVFFERFVILDLLLESYDLLKVNTSEYRDVRPIYLASAYGRVNFLKKWVNYGLPLDVPDRNGRNTLLHCTVDWFANDIKTYDSLKFLLDHGANPNVQDTIGFTALHKLLLKYYNRKRIDDQVKLMLREIVRSGADINQQDKFGRTTLHTSKMFFNYNCLFELLKLGADVNIEDSEGCTIFDYIEKDLQDLQAFDDLVDRYIPMIEEVKMYETTRVLVYHSIKLNTLQLYVSERTKAIVEELIPWLKIMDFSRILAGVGFSWPYTENNLSEDDINNFTEKSRVERKKLQDLKLDDGTSFYDIILKKSREMSRLTLNQNFKEYLTARQHKTDFPIFWLFLELQYNKGVTRRLLLPYARYCLKLLMPKLPDVCADLILDNIRNNELIHMINNLCHEDIKLSAILRKSNDFIFS